MFIFDIIAFFALGLYSFRNHQKEGQQFDHYKIRVNERLDRLEKAARANGWVLPFCSFGFFTDEDTYPGYDAE